MKYLKLVKWILNINDDLFDEMKTVLLEKYIDFSIIDNDNVTKEILCEKLCETVEKTMLKTGKSFEELINYYVASFSCLVEEYLEKELKGKDTKGKPIYGDSRAIMYYNRSLNMKKYKDNPYVWIEDFSRIMFCLYSEIIKNKHQGITDFDYSYESVKCRLVINALESEETKGKKFLKFKLQELNKRFKSYHKYSLDSFFMIISVIMLYRLKNKQIRGDF